MKIKLDNESAYKRCYACNRTLLKEEHFYKSSARSDNYATECKECAKKQKEKRHKADPEKYKERNKKYMAEYYKNNKEKAKINGRMYREDNKLACRERNSKYYIQNKVSICKQSSKYKKNNKTKVREQTQRRRSLKKNAICENFTTQDIVSLYGDVCFYYKTQPFEHMDHFVPLSRGGSHTLSNIRPACAECNLRKGARMPEEFENFLKRNK